MLRRLLKALEDVIPSIGAVADNAVAACDAPANFTPFAGRASGLPASLLRPGNRTGKMRTHNVTAAQARKICAEVTARNRKREYERDPINCTPRCGLLAKKAA